MFHSKVRRPPAPDLADPASTLLESSSGRDYPFHSKPFGQPTRATSSVPDWISTITPQTFVRESPQTGQYRVIECTADSRCRHGVSEDELQVRLTAHLNSRLSGNQVHRYDRVEGVGEKLRRANYGRPGQVSSERELNKECGFVVDQMAIMHLSPPISINWGMSFVYKTIRPCNLPFFRLFLMCN